MAQVSLGMSRVNEQVPNQLTTDGTLAMVSFLLVVSWRVDDDRIPVVVALVNISNPQGRV